MNGDRIRELLNGGTTVLMPGVWDALSARLTAEAGFEVCFVSGYASSATLLGLPDFGYLTQTEIAEVARRVCTAVPQMAVVVDGDTGHGNPLNTIRTVDLFERAGAGGIFLEDQVWPKKCGHMRGKRVIEREEYIHKIRAAVEARAGRDFFIVARTDALAAVSLDGKAVSSTRIRDSIKSGDLDAASQMLGRAYSLAGTVVRGDRLGRETLLPAVIGDIRERQHGGAPDASTTAAQHLSLVRGSGIPTTAASEMAGWR